MIGAGKLAYPPDEVLKALMDACSNFNRTNSTLRYVKLVVWNEDPEQQKVCKLSLLHMCRQDLVSYSRPSPEKANESWIA